MLAPDDPPLAAALAAAAVSTSHARLATTLALAARRATSSPLSFLRTAALNDVSRQVLVLAADSQGRDMLRAALAEDEGLAAAVAAAAVSPLRVAAEGSVTPTPDVTATDDGRGVSSAEVEAAARALEGVCLASPGARAAAVAAGAPAALAAALHKTESPHHVKPLLHAAGAVLIDGEDAVAAFSSGGGVRAAARAAAGSGGAGAAFLRLLLLHIAPATRADADAVRADVDGVLGPGASDALATRRSSEG